MLGTPPPPHGLYDPRFEHDACGVAFVATLSGEPSHQIVEHALTALRNLDHRGASGSEPDSGDGAGMLLQVPDSFLRAVTDLALPAPGEYAVGTAFLPNDDAADAATVARITEIATEEGLDVLGWRDVRWRPSCSARTSRAVMPRFRQLFLTARGADGAALDGLALDRRAFALRKRVEHETDAYFPSLSSRTIVYKGMLTTEQLEPFFPDLSDRRVESAVALVHSRFSTNTFPSWPLAHPYRYVAHNGEINTVMGNENWMRAREALLESELSPARRCRRRPGGLFPICTPARVTRRVRRGARAVADRRPFAAARGADDDSGGVGEPRRDGLLAARVLRVPLRPDGAVGRPGLCHVHRRHPGRRGPRPQRPAPEPVLGDRRRPGGAGLARSAFSTSTRSPLSARAGWSLAGCSWWTPRSTGSSRTRRSRLSSPPSTRTTSGCTPG